MNINLPEDNHCLPLLEPRLGPPTYLCQAGYCQSLASDTSKFFRGLSIKLEAQSCKKLLQCLKRHDLNLNATYCNIYTHIKQNISYNNIKNILNLN